MRFADSTNYVATGGTTWPQYVAMYAKLKLYPFAIAGATCSNKLSPRIFRDVTQDQLALYYNLTASGTKLKPSETVYSLWIGAHILRPASLHLALRSGHHTQARMMSEATS